MSTNSSSITNIPESFDQPYLSGRKKGAIIDNSEKLIKQGIWIYYFLLIFEGALRKWVFPGLATPLLVIRDPIAIWVIFLAWRSHVFPANKYVIIMFWVAIAAIFSALTIGHGNIIVALFGARPFLIHFPLMFIIGRTFNRDDVIKLGKVTLWIAIFSAILLGFQFYSPQSAWINRGIGGDKEGGGFNGGALGFLRPPGTFSFTAGNAYFFSMVSPFIFYFWLNKENVNRIVLVAATIGLIAAIPLSISRTLLFEVGLTAVFAMLATLNKPAFLGRLIVAIVGIFLLLMLLGKASFFQTATDAFSIRFDNASESEGGVVGGTIGTRFFGGMIDAVSSIATPLNGFWGAGLGMGTNVGAQLIAGDRNQFLISEEEWGRLIGEMGPLLGLIAIFMRVEVCYKISLVCYKKLRQGDMLPWMFLSVGILLVVTAQWGVPTSLGFSTLVGGLMLASLKNPKELIEVE